MTISKITIEFSSLYLAILSAWCQWLRFSLKSQVNNVLNLVETWDIHMYSSFILEKFFFFIYNRVFWKSYSKENRTWWRQTQTFGIVISFSSIVLLRCRGHHNISRSMFLLHSLLFQVWCATDIWNYLSHNRDQNRVICGHT